MGGHTGGAYHSFCSMKPLKVLLHVPPFPPGWDASPSQGYPQQFVASTHLYTGVERDKMEYSFLCKETTQWQGLGLKPPTFRSEVQSANNLHHHNPPTPHPHLQ